MMVQKMMVQITFLLIIDEEIVMRYHDLMMRYKTIVNAKVNLSQFAP